MYQQNTEVFRRKRDRERHADQTVTGGFTPRQPYFLCQVCHADVARFPRLKHYDFRFFTWVRRVNYVTPMVCATCRMMRQPEVTRLGDGRRRFWKRVISWYLNDPYPSMGHGMMRAFVYRQAFMIVGMAWARLSFKHPMNPENTVLLSVMCAAFLSLAKLAWTDLRHGIKDHPRG